ncbi:MAG: MFS transporter [Proteobacteria bacterium]|nr:MFS transporter [Pseudomonadota bacterium]
MIIGPISIKRDVLNLTVIVSALGYFVDIYDLVLFSIVRMSSLRSLGVPEERLLDVGVRLLNMQMTGMLLGGIIWGILGDKLGRLSVLFGSILLYSVANIANGLVTNVDAYAWLRLIAGIGLAGELGAAITLVSESLSKETRGIGTSVVAAVGVSGALLAATIGKYSTWQTAYMIGGVLGLMLLVLRFKTLESSMFQKVKEDRGVSRGDFRMLFTNLERFGRYLDCIFIGIPLWFVVGILVTFSPEICKELGATGPVSAGDAIFWCYGGLVIGDIASGLISQALRSRKKALWIFQIFSAMTVIWFLVSVGKSPNYYYFLCFLIGCGVGYWAIFVTTAAEQFGTNLRATVATTVPNFVRGSVVIITTAFTFLRPQVGTVQSALTVGIVCFLLGFFALRRLQESFGRDLNYLET